MKLSSSQKRLVNSIGKDEAVAYVANYENAVIGNIKYSAPLSSPENFNVYAEVRNVNGEVILAATLDMCVDRLAVVAALRQKHSI